MNLRAAGVIGVVVVGVLAYLAIKSQREPEPVFEGRKLSDWLHHHVPSSGAIPPYGSQGWKKADEAIRAIGTNGIPTFLNLLRERDESPWVAKVKSFARSHRLAQPKNTSATWRHEEAAYAFEKLGKTATNAVPQLIRIYRENISPSSQRCVAMSLGHIGRGAQDALATLINDFNHTNADVRFYAVSAVMDIGGRPDLVVPALTSSLNDSNVNVRWNALVGLSMFAGQARSATPKLLGMLNDPGMVGSSSITQQVQTALWRIAPEKIGFPLLVEDATPMVHGQVTTQALKMTLHGKRKTLIAPNRQVPVVAQYWNSDPRPKLTLYRGDTNSEQRDKLLGEFEVLDVPMVDNVNISTLCVIADGRIYICARDNTQERFLRIRRAEAQGTP